MNLESVENKKLLVDQGLYCFLQKMIDSKSLDTFSKIIDFNKIDINSISYISSGIDVICNKEVSFDKFLIRDSHNSTRGNLLIIFNKKIDAENFIFTIPESARTDNLINVNFAEQYIQINAEIQ